MSNKCPWGIPEDRYMNQYNGHETYVVFMQAKMKSKYTTEWRKIWRILSFPCHVSETEVKRGLIRFGDSVVECVEPGWEIKKVVSVPFLDVPEDVRDLGEKFARRMSGNLDLYYEGYK